jgi:hypothetical protein
MAKLSDIGHNIFSPITDIFKGPKPPKIPAATAMPDESQLAVARRRRLAEVLNRSGRDSTIMSDSALGG